MTLPTVYRTDGAAETKSIALSPGVYRAVVPATAGYTDAVSAPVTIKRRPSRWSSAGTGPGASWS